MQTLNLFQTLEVFFNKLSFYLETTKRNQRMSKHWNITYNMSMKNFYAIP